MLFKLLIGLLIIAVIVIVLSMKGKKKEEVVKPDLSKSGINPVGSYAGHPKEWGWSNCPKDRIEAGTYWINRVDGRTFLLGAFTTSAIATYGNYPKTYIKEVASRPPKGTCIEII